jgi:hypothetical protein
VLVTHVGNLGGALLNIYDEAAMIIDDERVSCKSEKQC